MVHFTQTRSSSNSQTLNSTKSKRKKKPGSSSTPTRQKRSSSRRLGVRKSDSSRTCATQPSWASDRGKLRKGLSPPTSQPKSRGQSSLSRRLRMTSTISSKDEGFDKTQWERSRFAAEVQEDCDTNLAAETAPVVNDNAPLLGEGRQITQNRGEHLLRRPKFPIFLLCIELLISLGSIGVWVVADNPVLPQMITYVNLGLILVHAAMALIFEFFRVHVSSNKSSQVVSTKTHYIAYRWRFIMLFAHLLRALLLAANMTIMALDHDFDTGSIIVLAIQPIHLIIVGIHIIIALLPKIKNR